MDGGHSLEGGNHGDQGEYSTEGSEGGLGFLAPPAALGRLKRAATTTPYPRSFRFCFFFAFRQGPGKAARPSHQRGAGRLPQGRITPKLTCRYGA